MIVDTSALMAIFQREPEANSFLETLAVARAAAVSAVSVVETGIVLSYRKGQPMQAAVEHLLRRLAINVVPFTDQHRVEALNAHWRYGRGRHPAALNFGDCIAYATAKLSAEPLLFKGHDFSQTDIEPAVEPQ